MTKNRGEYYHVNKEEELSANMNNFFFLGKITKNTS